MKIATLITATALLGFAPTALHAEVDTGPDMVAARAKTFGILDKNSDGSLSLDEFMDRQSTQQYSERSAIGFDRMDKDGSGSLSKEEFVNGPKARDELFDILDKNADGILSKDEFMAAGKSVEEPERAARVFELRDTDGSDSLSKEEFVNDPKSGKTGE